MTVFDQRYDSWEQPQQCPLCGAFIPKPEQDVSFICGKCGAEFEKGTK